jgi:hypothetical protein
MGPVQSEIVPLTCQEELWEECMYGPTFSCPRHWLEVTGQLRVLAVLPTGILSVGGWVGDTTSLEDTENRKSLPLVRPEPVCLSLTACSQSNTLIRLLRQMCECTLIQSVICQVLRA